MFDNAKAAVIQPDWYDPELNPKLEAFCKHVGTVLMLEVILRRHELRATIMTSNRPLEDWGKLIGDVPSATAILDGFLHHAEVIQITGRIPAPRSSRQGQRRCEAIEDQACKDD